MSDPLDLLEACCRLVGTPGFDSNSGIDTHGGKKTKAQVRTKARPDEGLINLCKWIYCCPFMCCSAMLNSRKGQGQGHEQGQEQGQGQVQGQGHGHNSDTKVQLTDEVKYQQMERGADWTYR
tara:strand:- start:14906 stop:15271 length:366 start_codon:yes stop_codon:yes gene_type:complete